MEDPYLPSELFQPNNALVYCDGCNRMYHQACHFVPLLVLPAASKQWYCLICQHANTKDKSHKPKRKQKSAQIDLIYPAEPTGSKEQTISQQEQTQQMIQQWEFDTRQQKAQLWKHQFQQVSRYILNQLQRMRQASSSLETLAFGRNREYFLSSQQNSQTMAQSLKRYTMAQVKLRDMLYSIEQVRLYGSSSGLCYLNESNKCMDALPLLQSFCKQHPNLSDYLFPYGMDLYVNHRRKVPRTREMKQITVAESFSRSNGLPLSISIPNSKHGSEGIVKSPKSKSPRSPKTKKNTAASKHKATTTVGPKHLPAPQKANPDQVDDDSSGVTLDDLQCCICFKGDATDDNDVLLCDGQGCFRAIHMHCVSPHVVLDEDEDSSTDWFCPLCLAQSQSLFVVQANYQGDEWEDRRHKMGDDADCTDSLKSWDHVNQVFPQAQDDYDIVVKLLEQKGKGKKNNKNKVLSVQAQRLLARVLREPEPESEDEDEQQQIVGSDSEDENDYSLFDEESFQEKKMKKDDDSSNSGSTRSSQATLVDMSSVEGIGKDELAALSEVSESSDKDSDSESDRDGPKRRSRRLRSSNKNDEDDDSDSSSQMGGGADLDEANIVAGKRRRAPVDYQKLNDALFGSLNDEERAKLDDIGHENDFVSSPSPKRKRKKPVSKKANKNGSKDTTTNTKKKKVTNTKEEKKNGATRTQSNKKRRRNKKSSEEPSDSDDDSRSSSDDDGSHDASSSNLSSSSNDEE